MPYAMIAFFASWKRRSEEREWNAQLSGMLVVRSSSMFSRVNVFFRGLKAWYGKDTTSIDALCRGKLT